MPNGRAVWSGEITSGVRRYVQLLQHEACRRHPQFPDCCNPRIEDWQHGPLGMLRYIWEDDVDIIWKDRSRIVTLPDSGVRIGVGGKTSEVPGFYKKDRVSKPVIYVYQRYESNDPRSRRAQFTVFHELAHYLLDTLPADAPLLSAELEACEDRSAFEERICDAFAANCLIPDELLKDCLKEYGLNSEGAAELYKRSYASAQCVAHRLRDCFRTSGFVWVVYADGRMRSISRGLVTSEYRVVATSTKMSIHDTCLPDTELLLRSPEEWSEQYELVLDGAYNVSATGCGSNGGVFVVGNTKKNKGKPFCRECMRQIDLTEEAREICRIISKIHSKWKLGCGKEKLICYLLGKDNKKTKIMRACFGEYKGFSSGRRLTRRILETVFEELIVRGIVTYAGIGEYPGLVEGKRFDDINDDGFYLILGNPEYNRV